MKIYTKQGDTGHTSLLGGTRVSKAHLRIETYGTVDELNAHIGLIGTFAKGEDAELLKEVQDRLFTIGSRLATDPGKEKVKVPMLHHSDVELLEKAIDRIQDSLPELRSFVLAGGCIENAQVHIARCVCRRAERLVVHLGQNEEVEDLIVKYLNRLSDYLFSLSRKVSVEMGAPEVSWTPRQ